jgi:PAS domain S-box-containing protein
MAKLLVVDDNEQNRYLLQALFTGHGHTVILASDGVEALEKGHESPPDLIITDILMPRMDGYTLCRQWKEDENLKKTPLVFYTGTYTKPQDKQFALDLGAEKFLVKPQEPEDLLREIDELLLARMTKQHGHKRTTRLEERTYLKQYNEILIQKLEDKIAELETVNARLKLESEERKRTERLLDIRFKLNEFALNHSLDELMVKALDEICEFEDSPIGFYHFVESDQQTLTLQQWSTRTLKEFCRAGGKGVHYPINDAGVWAECARKREPVIHNDYESLKNKKGMPEGHAKVIRELTIPIIRKGKLVAILGIGNKPTKYTQEDIKIVSFLADVTWIIVEHKKAEEALLKAHKQLRWFVDANIVGVIIAKVNGEIVEANDYYLDLIGLTRADLESKQVNWRTATPPEWIKADENAIRELYERGVCTPFKKEYRRSNGARVPVFLTATLLPGVEKQIAAFVLDLTEQKNLEEQLRQLQKMEAIGKLAGGIAHDFNNILQAIMGCSQILQEYLTDQKEAREIATEITHGAERAAMLTRQLLAFSRRQILEMKNLHLGDVVENVSKMIKRLIGEDITLRVICDPGLGTVCADTGQMEQLLINLCVNARDAMSGGGTLTIELCNITLDMEYCANHVWTIPGDYVQLSVTDTGIGMTPEVLEHVFEPFFTTKETGKGTGLGLATIYGIVRQHHGSIFVYSEVNQGTTFKIYLPLVEEKAIRLQPKNHTKPRGGTETILVVEDNDLVRASAIRVLESAGYNVLTAINGLEAIKIINESPNDVDLIISDVVMPEMGGKRLYEYLKKEQKCPRFLFSSGYGGDAMQAMSLDEEVEFIQKPYALHTLLNKVRELLDQ